MRLFSVLLLCSLTFACTKSAEETQQPREIPKAGMAGASQPAEQQEQTLAEAQKNRRILKGKVVEAIYKEGFAYVRLEMDKGGSTWVAIVNQKPTVGESISVQEQAVLTDFHSKSLDRTFNKIVFGSIVKKDGET